MKDQIMKRKSVRAYTGEPLTEMEKRRINEYLEQEGNRTGVLGNQIRLKLVEPDGIRSGKIGTYGKITDAPAFVTAQCRNGKDVLFDLGAVFENLILFLESINLNTCWLGATFDRDTLTTDTEPDDGEFIPAIISVGKSKIPVSEQESTSRKDFDKLFHSGKFGVPITNKKGREILEYVRAAPSASNFQPWRIVMDGEIAHFYIKRNPNIAKYGLSYDIQWLDIGIAVSHYRIASEKTDVFRQKPDITIIEDISEYVISVR